MGGSRGARLEHFEVDSTESVWYSFLSVSLVGIIILKLTPQSQYGIRLLEESELVEPF